MNGPPTNPPTPKQWFQLSLSSAVIVTLSTGMMLWANLRPRTIAESYYVESGHNSVSTIFGGTAYGWPFQVYFRNAEGGEYDQIAKYGTSAGPRIELRHLNGLYNVLFVLAILILEVVCFEVCVLSLRRYLSQKQIL